MFITRKSVGGEVTHPRRCASALYATIPAKAVIVITTTKAASFMDHATLTQINAPTAILASGSMSQGAFSYRRRTMDWNRVAGNWKQTQGTIRQKWGKLTDNDLALIDGKREQLEGLIQERYGFAKDQVRKDVDAWLKSQP
jgi:uncharacterized protein YjbJ (UPF0337 family)